MTARICQTCKHYEPSSVWRRGWCRNPRLYSPQQSHLVEQDSLDCSRGLGSSWEAADASAADRPAERAEKQAWQPLRLFVPQQRLAPAGGLVMASSGLGSGTGGGGTGGSGGSLAGPPRPERPGPPSGTERTVSYQPEERYWTDYLRIALPVAGLLILLGVGWWWAGQIIGGGDDDDGPATEVALGEVATIAASPPPETATATAASVAPSPGAAPTPTATTTSQAGDIARTPAAVAETAESIAPVPTPAESTEEGEPASDLELADYPNGTTVVTLDTVNVREGPSTQTDTVIQIPAGTSIFIRGAFEADAEGGDNEWWPVALETGEEGYVREDLIRAAP